MNLTSATATVFNKIKWTFGQNVEFAAFIC